MEISNTFHIGTDYKDRKASSGWDIRQFIEILFVDKTGSSHYPLLYQLDDSQDSFLLIGEIFDIDKQKKQVCLINKAMISYNHLIIVSGKKSMGSFQEEELAAALQALSDAIRVQPKIPESFPVESTHYSTCLLDRKPIFPTPSSEEEQNVEKTVLPYIENFKQHLHAFAIDAQNSRFYEVQI